MRWGRIMTIRERAACGTGTRALGVPGSLAESSEGIAHRQASAEAPYPGASLSVFVLLSRSMRLWPAKGPEEPQRSWTKLRLASWCGVGGGLSSSAELRGLVS